MQGILHTIGRWAGVILTGCGLAATVLAQDVAITDARIIVGNGDVIESGTIVVRDGRITDVANGMVNTRGLTTIDGTGMTAMPGFIDAHRHINTGPDEREEMQAHHEAVPAPVEGTVGARGLVIARGHGPDGREGAEAQGRQGGLRPARQDHVCLPGADQPQRLP
jgi:hypothetical protein